ncbi:MAG TPA: amidohydrolase family protein [Steroidobacteraceae bacterium]|jgi:N-acyl-D-amino-acid deacylase|nr:amidohydrolase family protein [Steroidobacteraceae bacterium]
MKLRIAAAALLGWMSSAAASPAQSAPLYDVVIRNGHLLDGAGNPWVNADIAIKDGRFVKVGRVEGRGAREIDAEGDYVSPGWIDMMDQSGEVLLKNGLAENKLREGVTSAIAGEGGTPVPSAQIADYFKKLETQGISLNFGTYYSSAQARVEVMGDVAGHPSHEQMERMKAHVDEAMRAGAMGIATALIYPPDSFQTTEDLIELARVAAKRGGIYASHMRDESAQLLKAIGESIEIGEKTGIQVEIFHFKGAYAPGWGKLVPQAGALIESARARGVSIAADMYVYTAGGTGLDITVPNWLWEQGAKVGLERLKDPAVRARLKKEVAGGSLPGWSNLVEASGGWDHIVLANAFNPQYDRYRFKSIAFIAKQLGKDPADVAWDIVLAAQPNRAMGLYFMMNEPDIETALRWPWMSIGSDAGANEAPGKIDAIGLPHPRAYANFPRVIAEYVKKRHVLTLEDAIRKMTSWPATRMHLYDRGAIREGLKADVTVFNEERLEDVATYENPTAYPTGIDYVLVNGKLVIDKGHHTGAKPGNVLRGLGYEPDAHGQSRSGQSR